MITVKKGDITKEKCDAIVNPANSFGLMGGGVALAIKRKGGKIIEDQAIMKAPILVGKAVATSGGKLKCKYVIHAPTMFRPAQKIGIDNVRKATRAALECAKKMGLKTVALPGMGTGVGGVSYDDAAKAMIEEAKKFKELKIRLIGFNDKLVKAFKSHLGK